MLRCLVAVMLLLSLPGLGQSSATTTSGVLQASDLQTLVPPTVYFSGQSASVQLRNSAGVRWEKSKQTLFAMVDVSGYSSAVRDRYQFYILTDTAIDLAGHVLPPGAYGAGFLENAGLLVMDLGGTEIFRAPYSPDATMKRPRPLQVMPGVAAGEYRLYLGRNYVAFHNK